MFGYWITSSARSSSDCGMVRPSALNHPGDDWKSGHTTPAGRLRRFDVHPLFRQASINDCHRARRAM